MLILRFVFKILFSVAFHQFISIDSVPLRPTIMELEVGVLVSEIHN